MKIIKKLNILILTIGLATLGSCDLEGGESLNGASTSSISDDLSRGELPQAISGILSDMRVGLNTQVDVLSMFGREYYFITGSDPRWEADVVTGNLDNNTFYTTGPWGSRYAAIKDINLTIQGLENTTTDFSTAEIAGIRGVLNTLKAHELLMVANNQFSNGIRIDVSDPDNLGAFVTYDGALTAIADLLSSAGTDLVGGVIPFSLGDGYQVPFIEFNKGLAARVEAYRGNYPAVLTLLGDSFMDMSGDLKTGVYHTFSLSGADLPNPLFSSLNQVSLVRIAHPSFTSDAEAGDARVNKAVLRDASFSTDDTGNGSLTGTHDVWIYQTNVDNIPLVRNEELILLSAEANHITNPTAAVDAINVVRNGAGLGNYAGATTPAALVDEILLQRRYSLFGEGHRWVDMRRFDKLSDLPNDRSVDNIISAVPIPANENQ